MESLDLLTIQEVADLLGCSKPHVYRLIGLGVIATVNIATPGAKRPKTRIRPDDLKAYINAS